MNMNTLTTDPLAYLVKIPWTQIQQSFDIVVEQANPSTSSNPIFYTYAKWDLG